MVSSFFEHVSIIQAFLTNGFASYPDANSEYIVEGEITRSYDSGDLIINYGDEFMLDIGRQVYAIGMSSIGFSLNNSIQTISWIVVRGISWNVVSLLGGVDIIRSITYRPIN